MQPPSRVLLVDEKQAVRESLELSLEGFVCDFSQAATGTDALRLLRQGKFDVTFLEVDLPDIPGMEVLRQARDEGLPTGEVIVVTSLHSSKEAAAAKQLSAFKYVEKPLEYEQARALLGEVTSARAVAPDLPVIPILEAVEPPVETSTIVPLGRVLVLDDHTDWLLQIRESLEKEFEVVATMDEDDACWWANQEPFDMVVIEEKLVGTGSGFDVLSVMRRAKPKLRAIMLGDYSEFRPRLDPRSAIGYVSKKELAKLANTVRLFLDHPLDRKRVFLSYAVADRALVLKLYEALTARGYLPWMDFKSIIPGKKWEPDIKAAIEASDFFVFCLSRESTIKEGVIVKELNWALDKQKGVRSRFIITACLEDIPIEPPLDEFQGVPLYARRGMLELMAALSATDGHPKPPFLPPAPRSDASALGIHRADSPLRDLIATGESERLEFKASLRWDFRQQKTNKDLETKIVQTVAAFLNAHEGGTLLIGVADNGTIVGLDHDYQTLKKNNRDGFQAHAYQLFIEKYGKDVASLVHLGFEAIDGRDVCRVYAQPAHKPIYIDRRLYIRTGNMTHELSAQEAVEYTHERWK
jgi:DNA-binding response OmpR family regulator